MAIAGHDDAVSIPIHRVALRDLNPMPLGRFDGVGADVVATVELCSCGEFAWEIALILMTVTKVKMFPRLTRSRCERSKTVKLLLR